MKKALLAVLALILFAPSSWAQQSVVQAEVVDRTSSGALGALNAAVTVSLQGRLGVGGFVATGTLSGTVTPEVTIDGSTWLATSVYNFSAGAAPVRATTVSLNTLFSVEIPSGTKQARLRVSAYSSGTSNASLLATTDLGAVPVTAIISGTVSTNVAQVNGTTTDTNSGAKSAGTQRVVLATDQPQLTNKLLVTPDSVALPANQSVNVAQLAGTTTDTNSGTKSAGTLRVVLATDQPALTNKLLVTPDSVALPANQSVNVAQVAGTATSVNNGTVDAGTQRVTIASDSTGKVTVTPVAVSSSNNDGACTSVSTNTTVLASFATRRGAVVMAQCDPSACNTDTVFIKLAATATTSDFPLAPGDKFVLQGSAVYTGIIDAIANSGTQKVCVVEF